MIMIINLHLRIDVIIIIMFSELCLRADYSRTMSISELLHTQTRRFWKNSALLLLLELKKFLS